MIITRLMRSIVVLEYSYFPQIVSPQIVSFTKFFENAQLVSFEFLIKRCLEYYVFSVHLWFDPN